MKRQIEYLETTNGQVHRPCPKGNFPVEGYLFKEEPECVIKHLGQHIYLVGYFDEYKIPYEHWMGHQDLINTWELLFPSAIKRIKYK